MKVAKELWASMLTNLEIETSAVNFDVWIKTLEAINIIDTKLILVAPSVGSRNFVSEKFKDIILKAMLALNPSMTDIIFIDASMKEFYAGREEAYGEVEEPIAKVEPTVINPKYNFETFVVGKSNQFMYAAARAVADEPGIRHNPLFIYGGTGLGKTHIMHAIGNAVKISHPNLKVLYVSSEKFVNEFIESIRTTKGKNTDFRDKYRCVDVLMIDDIQFIAGKEGTQQEMFHTFNDLYNTNKQVIMTSDRPPKEIPDLEERLRSRFEWGLIADVQSPDLETRIAILQKKAQVEKYNIPMNVLTFMAESLDSNIRDMESLLNKVIFLSKLYCQAPNVDIVKEALKDYNDRSEDTVTADNIIDCTCKYYANVTREDLIGKKKTKEIVEPRQMCIYLITDLLSLPLASIGNLFGGRDHTTIMHARDKIAEKIQTNPKTKVVAQDIKDMVFRK